MGAWISGLHVFCESGKNFWTFCGGLMWKYRVQRLFKGNWVPVKSKQKLFLFLGQSRAVFSTDWTPPVLPLVSDPVFSVHGLELKEQPWRKVGQIWEHYLIFFLNDVVLSAYMNCNPQCALGGLQLGMNQRESTRLSLKQRLSIGTISNTHRCCTSKLGCDFFLLKWGSFSI